MVHVLRHPLFKSVMQYLFLVICKLASKGEIICLYLTKALHSFAGLGKVISICQLITRQKPTEVTSALVDARHMAVCHVAFQESCCWTSNNL